MEEVRCNQCGNLIEAGTGITLRDRYGNTYTVCSERCASRIGYVQCHHCGEWVRGSATHRVWEGEELHQWCSTCADSYSYRCCICGRRQIELMERDEAGNRLCNECQSIYSVCAGCGRYVQTINLRPSADGSWYCNQCLPENFGTCAGCGSREHIRYLTLSADGSWYCNQCLPENKTYVRGYHHAPILLHDGKAEGYDESIIRYGIEWEIDDGDDSRKMSQALYKLSENESIFFQERDGSLSEEGIEIITHPFSDPLHSVPWGEILKAMKHNGYKSGNTSQSTGIHIHFSTAPFGKKRELMEAKMVLFFSIHEEHIESIARRSSERWSQVKKIMKPIDEADCLNALRDSKRYGNRYEAVNLMNRNTIEIRVFKGTNNLKTLLATISFVKTIVEFCQKASVAEVRDTNFQEVLRTSNDENLIEYAASRGIDMKEGMN